MWYLEDKANSCCFRGFSYNLTHDFFISRAEEDEEESVYCVLSVETSVSTVCM
jgi:hypothetical protein